jgi:hypothetical protein
VPRGIAACLVGIGSLYRFGYSFASPPCHPHAARHFGLRRSGVRSLPTVDIQLDRTWSAADRKRRTNGWTSQAEGVYPGLDRFGRVVRQTWLDGATGSTAAGYRPAIVDQIHTYDLASNRLSKRDGRAGASWDALGAAVGALESESCPKKLCGAPRDALRQCCLKVGCKQK